MKTAKIAKSIITVQLLTALRLPACPGNTNRVYNAATSTVLSNAEIRIVAIHRYPQDYDEGTPCRMASTARSGERMIEGIPPAGDAGSHTEQISTALDILFAGLDQHAVEIQPRLDAAVNHGSDAVPLLIERYRLTDDRQCWPLVYCLCRIGTPEALQFVRGIMKEHQRCCAALSAMKLYPEDREDEIIDLLIGLLDVGEYRAGAAERLKECIGRKPEFTGRLVVALQDDPAFDGTYIYGVLADLSGLRYTWSPTITATQDRVVKKNDYWRAWWERNRGRDVFGWLEEAASSDNESRRATALQRMRICADERALPYYLAGLDHPSDSVQYWAIVGLRTLEGTKPSGGYRSEGAQLEKDREILRLKNKYGGTGVEKQMTMDELHALQYASAMAGRSEEGLAELQHRDVPPAFRASLLSLFSQYYPDVKYTYLDLNGIRFAYHAKHIETPLNRKGVYAAQFDDIPEPGGILCSVTSMRGPYLGPGMVSHPGGNSMSRFIKQSTHNILLMAPYSKVSDSHLWIKLEYPDDVNPRFLSEFRQVSTAFEQYGMTDELDTHPGP